jgi:pimeloyl-ACP methyl ester carboxylesterase
MLLHGLPQHWWSMRHLLRGFAAQGFSAHALDLRGAGASDKPPEGYTLPMLARDVAGVISALGRQAAVVVGQGFGGQVAWTMATRAPEALSAIVPICSAHPGSLVPKRRWLVSPRAFAQVSALRWPFALRRWLTDEHAMAALLTTWVSDPAAIAPEAAHIYAEALRIPSAANKVARMLRWPTRPLIEAGHARFVASARAPAPVPVLQIQTDADPLLRWTVAPAHRLGGSDYTFELLHGVGHLAPEEAPDVIVPLVVDWLRARGLGSE